MIRVLIDGTLHKPAETRTSKGGATYTTARIRVDSEDRDGAATTVWASVIAFSDEAQEILKRLQPGDCVSVGGKAKITTWEKDGRSGIGLDVVADTAAAARAVTRKAKRPDSRPDHRAPNGWPQSTAQAPFVDDADLGF